MKNVGVELTLSWVPSATSFLTRASVASYFAVKSGTWPMSFAA